MQIKIYIRNIETNTKSKNIENYINEENYTIISNLKLTSLKNGTLIYWVEVGWCYYRGDVGGGAWMG